MKLGFQILLLLLGLSLASPVTASDSFHSLIPFKFISLFFNLDNFLASSAGLRPITCHYKSFVLHSEGDFEGLGPCLYQVIVDGFKTNAIPGVITAKFELIETKKPTTLIIAWRPTKGSFGHLINKLDKDWRKIPDVADKDTLLGTLVLDVSQMGVGQITKIISGVLGVAFEKIPPEVVSRFDQLTQVRMSSSPLHGDEIQSHTKVGLYFRPPNKPYQFYWNTDFTLIPPRRDQITNSGGDHSMKKILIVSGLSLILSSLTSADQAKSEEGCRLSPREINEQAKGIVDVHSNSKIAMDDSLVVYTDFSMTKAGIVATNAEGFLRPLSTATYPLIQPLILSVKLTRENDAIYICAHYKGDISTAFVTLYFLHGYGLERQGLKNDISNFFHKKDLKISPIKLSFFAVDQSLSDISAILGKIPILNILTDLPSQVIQDIQSDLEGAITELGGVGVERIVLKHDQIQIATGIDLDNPNQAQVIKTIDLKSKIPLKNTDTK